MKGNAFIFGHGISTAARLQPLPSHRIRSPVLKRGQADVSTAFDTWAAKVCAKKFVIRPRACPPVEAWRSWLERALAYWHLFQPSPRSPWTVLGSVRWGPFVSCWNLPWAPGCWISPGPSRELVGSEAPSPLSWLVIRQIYLLFFTRILCHALLGSSRWCQNNH